MKLLGAKGAGGRKGQMRLDASKNKMSKCQPSFPLSALIRLLFRSAADRSFLFLVKALPWSPFFFGSESDPRVFACLALLTLPSPKVAVLIRTWGA